MTQFNTGDRVRTVTDDEYNGREGVVKPNPELSAATDTSRYVLLDGAKNPLYFDVDELNAIPRVYFSEEFPVGTLVRVNKSLGDFPDGSIGTVVERSAYAYGDELTLAMSERASDKYFARPFEVTKVETDFRLTIKTDKLPTLLFTSGAPRRYEYTFEGDYTIDVEEVPATKYVQVDYSADGESSLYLYSYIDPSGTLVVGDCVEVPVTYGTKVGIVRALGKGSYTGLCKTVLAKITRESL